MLDFRNDNAAKYSTLSLLASPKMGRSFPRPYTKIVDDKLVIFLYFSSCQHHNASMEFDMQTKNKKSATNGLN